MTNTKRSRATIIRVLPLAILAALLPACETSAQESTAPAKPAAKRAAPDQETLERQFQELLSGSQLVGTFTTVHADGREEPAATDRYTIESVKPLKNGFWQFVARIQYQQRDTKLPLALEVKWAGDTPVITLTNILVPGFGTFTARVLFYGDQYAGTWSAGDHGGHMFGRVEKIKAESEAAASSDAGPSDGKPVEK